LRRLKKNKTALVGGIIFLSFCLVGILSPLISPYDPLEMHIGEKLQPPSLKYLLGTDHLGRDVLSRIMNGCLTSLFVGGLSTLGAMSVGILIGVFAGFFGGKLDMALMRLEDLVMAIPLMLFAIGLIAFLGSGTDKVILVSSVCISPPVARMVRGKALSIKSSDYILAAKGLGLSDARIIFRHILPNLIGPIVVLATLTLGFAIMIEAGLSFLGLGVSHSVITLGSLVSDGREFFRTAPGLVVFSGLTITLIVMGANLFGDGLRDALDPQRKK